jgi:hypothetical protein
MSLQGFGGISRLYVLYIYMPTRILGLIIWINGRPDVVRSLEALATNTKSGG